MANNFKKVIDRQMWVSSTPAPNAHGAAVHLVSDLRSDVSRNPFVYQLASATVLNRYNIVTKAWHFVGSPGMAALAAGATSVFAPTFGAQGTVTAAGTTDSKIVLNALPAAVGVNMLANRGGSGEYGFKIRIIGKTAGKVEERFITANTGGTTSVVVLLDNPLTFTPTTNDEWELLSGRLMMLSSGAPAAASWRSLEVGTNFFLNLTNTNLPTVGTDSTLVALDEQYTPFDCNPGEGFIKGTFQYDSNVSIRMALAATGAAAGTITGQATGGDATVLANEYRNFQIRIVHDAVNTTSVGQRRIIASHTAGASPVYTLGTNWTVTPSSSAKFVIEYPNLIILRTAATTLYTYNYGPNNITNGTNTINAGAWSTAYFAAAGNAAVAGTMWMPSFGIRPCVEKNARHSYLYCWRGTSANLDLFDIAGGTTGAWTNAIVIDGGITTPANMSGCYAPFENEGRMFYLNPYVASQVSQIFRFDVQNRVLMPYTPTDEIQAGTAALGNRMAAFVAIDGTDTYDVLFLQSHTAVRTQELIPLV
jgi:uncharacterized protein YaiE (UPF0345 family)